MLPTATSSRHLSDSTPYTVGITGGIGSGKSVATAWFTEQGIAVIDADVIAHAVVAKDSPALHKIVKKFGEWVLTSEGQMDRAAMRAHVFSHPAALIELEAIMHPAVRQRANELLVQADTDYVMISAPLLLEAAEAGLANLCQRILVVDVPEALQITRASQRDGQTQAKIKAIMQNQLTREQRCEQADDVVINDGSIEQLHTQLVALHQRYLRAAQHYRRA